MPRTARLILAVLACYRLAQLVANDDGPGDIFRKLRQWADRKQLREQKGLIAQKSESEWMGTLEQDYQEAIRGKWANISDGLHCPFCVGMWAAGLLALLVSRPTKLGDFILTALGLAGGQTWLENKQR